MSRAHIKIECRAHAGSRNGVIVLVSTNARDSHLNLFLGDGYGTPCYGLHPDDAKALRDALNEIYPLEAAAPAAPGPLYGVEFKHGNWTVLKRVAEPRYDHARYCITGNDEAAARAIADALNTQEPA